MSNILPGRKITLETCKAYATQANLEKALAKIGLDRYDYIECRTAEGKWTAIFSFNQARQRQGECYVPFAAAHGFMQFG
jgi:hypothetical protein